MVCKDGDGDAWMDWNDWRAVGGAGDWTAGDWTGLPSSLLVMGRPSVRCVGRTACVSEERGCRGAQR